MRVLTLLHRWIGIGLGLMFAIWFATGAVMVFVAFPSLSVDEIARASAPIALDRLRVAPAQAKTRFPGADDLRLIDFLGQPAYVARDRTGHDGPISGVSGEALGRVMPGAAGAIAAGFTGAGVQSIEGPFSYDQWIVHQQFDPARPFYRVRLADPPATELYISARTGEVLQRTRRYERGWNWLGSILHWIYIVPIRKSFALWDWTVWSVALIGVATTFAGIWLGVARLRQAGRSATRSASPFRGLLRWHHVLGLTAGLFVAAWITSGWLSMDHGRLFSDGRANASSLRAYQAGAGGPAGKPLSAGDVRRLQGASRIEFSTLAGHDIAAAHGPSGSRVLIAGPEGSSLGVAVPPGMVTAAARAGWPGDQVAENAASPTLHPYAKAEGLPGHSRLVRLTGPTPLRLYVDGLSGRILVAMTPSREAYAWAFYILHTYNYPGLSSRPALRITLLLIPLGLGLAFSLTGVLVGVRRLRLMR